MIDRKIWVRSTECEQPYKDIKPSRAKKLSSRSVGFNIKVPEQIILSSIEYSRKAEGSSNSWIE